MKTPQQLANELFQSLAFSTMAITNNQEYAINKARKISLCTFSLDMVDAAESDMNEKIKHWGEIAQIENSVKRV
jgi:predicted peroxiredoxin